MSVVVSFAFKNGAASAEASVTSTCNAVDALFFSHVDLPPPLQ